MAEEKIGAQAPVEKDEQKKAVVPAIPITPTKGFWGDAWDAAKAFWGGLGQKTQGIVIGVGAIVAIIILIALFHPFGLMAPTAPSATVLPVAGNDSSKVLEKLSRIEGNVTKGIEAVNVTANKAVAIAEKANATANAAKVVPATAGQPAGAKVEVSTTNTMDDKAYSDAKTYLAKANRIASDAARFKQEARDLDSDEQDDASDLEEDITDSKDNRDELKTDIEDLQDTIYQDWTGQPRNDTAKDLAGQTLTAALDVLSSAKEDYKDATSDVNDILDSSSMSQQGQQNQQVQGGQVSLPKLRSAT